MALDGEKPRLKATTRFGADQHFVADFALPEPGIVHTGPVQLTIQINGRTLKVLPFAKPGPQHVDLPIPPEWLTTQLDNYAVMEIDKTWRAEGTDHDYGFILSRAGFQGKP